jgi:hypothetical protein
VSDTYVTAAVTAAAMAEAMRAARQEVHAALVGRSVTREHQSRASADVCAEIQRRMVDDARQGYSW